MELIKLLMIGMFLFGIVWIFFTRKRELWKRMTDHVEKWSNRNIQIGLFLLDLITQGGFVFLRKYPISADEIYSIAGSAFFAGYKRDIIGNHICM